MPPDIPSLPGNHMKRIAVLISNKGTGSNLEAILRAIEKGKITNGKVVVVVSDKENAYGLVRAQKKNIPHVVFPLTKHKNTQIRNKYDRDLAVILKEKYQVDLVVLAGWMLILSENFIKYFPRKIINLHPGLLPDKGEYITLKTGQKIKAIRGLHTDAAVSYALNHHYPVTGSTVHFITPKVDDGKIIARSEVKIKRGDTIETLYKRMKREEHKILPRAINELCQKTLKILVIGSGGREHALVWKIAQSKKVDKIYCAPGNPGIGEIALNVPINIDQPEKLVQFAKSKKIDLTVVGPEIPLIAGIVDLFRKNKLPIIGPTMNAAQIEGSKVFAKKLLLKYQIPTADFVVFDDYKYAKEYLYSAKYPLVIKVDGPALGKGVKVCTIKKEAELFVDEVMKNKSFGPSGRQIIMEECLSGQEVSFMVATDGSNFVSFLPSQDHKRVFDNDTGPNTGGMGAYAPLPFVRSKLIKRIEKEIVAPTIAAMAKEGISYQGILYPGLILTKEGPKVLEFNCRFGDPETQPLMTLLSTDIIDIFQAIIDKKVKGLKLKWNNGAAVCVVLTSKGYPAKYETGKKINGLIKIDDIKNIAAFHSGTKIINNNFVSSGGRVLGITARDKNLPFAIKKVYKYIGKNGIHFSGMHYRKDIGKKGLIK